MLYFGYRLTLRFMMTMHLEGPWLSTTGKKKSKRKFASAEHARKARELDAEWKELQKRWGVEAEDKKRTRAIKAEAYVAPKPTHRGAEQTRIPSRGSGGGNATLKPAPVYTGNLMKGVSQMHKSNAVPVFRQEDIEDIARMRR
jgi:hypothetical protein